MSVIGSFQVFVFFSIFQVNFCYPDVNKGKAFSRSTRSEILNSLESIVDSPSTNPQSNVIKSLEDFLNVKREPIIKRSQTPNRPHPLLKKVINKYGKHLRTQNFQKTHLDVLQLQKIFAPRKQDTKRTKTKHKHIQKRELHASSVEDDDTASFLDFDGSSVLSAAENAQGSTSSDDLNELMDKASGSFELVSSSESSQTEPGSSLASSKTGSKKDEINEEESSSSGESGSAVTEEIVNDLMETSHPQAQSSEENNVSREGQSTATDPGYLVSTTTTSSMKPVAIVQKLNDHEDFSGEGSVSGQENDISGSPSHSSSGREFQGSQKDDTGELVKRNGISGVDISSAQASGISGLEEYSTTTKAKPNVPSKTYALEAVDPTDSQISGEESGSASFGSATDTEMDFKGASTAHLNKMGTIQEGLDENLEDVGDDSGNVASGVNMIQYPTIARTKKARERSESGVGKQTITDQIVVNNNLDAIKNDNDLNNIIDLTNQNDWDNPNTNNNISNVDNSLDKNAINQIIVNITNHIWNVTDNNNANTNIDNDNNTINVGNMENEGTDVSSGDVVGSGNDDETVGNSRQPYSDLSVLRKVPGPDLNAELNATTATSAPIPSIQPTPQAGNIQIQEALAPDIHLEENEPLDETLTIANQAAENATSVNSNGNGIPMRIHIDFSKLKNNLESAINATTSTANSIILPTTTPVNPISPTPTNNKDKYQKRPLNSNLQSSTNGMSSSESTSNLQESMDTENAEKIEQPNIVEQGTNTENSSPIGDKGNQEAPEVTSPVQLETNNSPSDEDNNQEVHNPAQQETNVPPTGGQVNQKTPDESSTGQLESNTSANDKEDNHDETKQQNPVQQQTNTETKTSSDEENKLEATKAESYPIQQQTYGVPSDGQHTHKAPEESNPIQEETNGIPSNGKNNHKAIKETNQAQQGTNNSPGDEESPHEVDIKLQNTNATTIHDNKLNAASEQEKKLIAQSIKGEQNNIPDNVTVLQLNQPKNPKEVKMDYDINKEKERIAASINAVENGRKIAEKVANAAELHDHAKATFRIEYIGQKGQKVEMRREQDKLAKLLDAVKFGKEPATVNRTMQFTNIKQCSLFVEDYNVTKVAQSWNRGILSQYPYLYEMPKEYSKCTTTTWLNHTDMRGSVFLSFQVRSILGNTMINNAHVCAKYCCHEPRCKAWTLRIQEGETRNCDKGAYCCWLKSAIPELHSNAENSTSGIVDRVHTKHPPTGMRSAVPLGGITTGSFELRADGTFHEWTIENQSPGGSAKLNKGALDLAVFGVRVSRKSSQEAALLRTYPPAGFPGVETLSYSGAYPVSKLTPDGTITNKLKMDLYAYSAFHPRDPFNSAVPAVTFTLNLENTNQFEPADVSFMMNLPLGYQEDTIRVGDNYGEAVFTRNIPPSECARACAKMPKCMAWTTNGPSACLLKDKMPPHAWQSGIISGLKGFWSLDGTMLTMERPGFFPQSGSTTLYVVEEEGGTASFAIADEFGEIWQKFSRSGSLGNFKNVSSMALHGSAAIRTTLLPGQKKSLSIVMAWYYPNRDHAEIGVGNFYSNLFISSQAVAQHMRQNLFKTVEDIIIWQLPFQLPNSFTQESLHVNKLPLWLNDLLMNSVSYWRSSFWTRDGRWRQWEAYDCNDIDTIHNDMRRMLPYMIFYPEVVRHLLLTWAANQYSNGMIQEALAEGCLGKTGRLDYAGGREMADTTSMFIVGVYHYYKWTGQKDLLDKLWPACKKAITWLMVDSTHGTGLPFRKTTFFSTTGIDKFDHHIYDSVVYLLALHTARDLATHLNDIAIEKQISAALDRAQILVEKEFWNEQNRYFRAWWDTEYGAADWLMSDSFYGQVWAYTLGIGDLVPRKKLRHHLEMEVEINDSPWGLKIIDDKRFAPAEEDTSLILSYRFAGCENLENVSKHKSIWMGADADWASMMIHLETDPHKALNQAKKPLDHWRSTLNDQWNIHEQISSGGYGQDGLPWANSHANSHLVMWHIPFAISGQQYSAVDGSLSFWPMMEVPFQLPFFIPTASGLIGAKIVNDNDLNPEEMFTFQVTSGEVRLKELKIFGTPYGHGQIHLAAGSTVSWSKPRTNVRNILNELKHK